jgi:membrane protease YdiL (CAAX protease family)
LIGSIIFSIVALAVTYGMAWWAYRAQRDRSAFVGLYLVIGIPAVLLIVAGVAFAVAGERVGAVLLVIGLGLGLPLVPNVRKALSRVTPIDPQSRIDMVGLSLLFGVMAFLAISLFAESEPSNATGSVGLADLLLQVILFVGLAFITVGTGVYRTLRQAIERLGLRPISVVGVVVAVVSVIGMLFISGTAGLITEWLQPDLIDDLNEVTDELTADVQNVPGAVALGLSAGIGEELLMRGAVQPRFGMVLTSVFFALLHTQYGWTFVLVGLFGISMLLGWLRNRYGTIAPIIAHALFNTIVVLIQAAA